MGSIVRSLLIAVLGVAVGASATLAVLYDLNTPPPIGTRIFGAPEPVRLESSRQSGFGGDTRPAASRAEIFDEKVVSDLYARLSPSVVNIATFERATGGAASGVGSGFFVDDRGYILTNNHVVRNATRLEIILADRSQIPAVVVGTDPGNDLAVIRADVPREKITVAELGDSDVVLPGQLAIAIGNPFALDRTITVGVISGLGRTIPTASRPIRQLLQTDAAINPGNSGGPLVDSKGRVIGINTAIETTNGSRVFSGIGFAVPISTARRSLADMIEGRLVEHPWLGISGTQITARIKAERGLSVSDGLLIDRVVRDGPAALAGLRAGDIVTAVDSQPVRDVDDVAALLDRTKRVDDTTQLSVIRGDQRLTITPKLQRWPDSLDSR